MIQRLRHRGGEVGGPLRRGGCCVNGATLLPGMIAGHEMRGVIGQAMLELC